MYQCKGNFCKGDASRLAKRALHFSECKIFSLSVEGGLSTIAAGAAAWRSRHGRLTIPNFAFRSTGAAAVFLQAG